MTPLRHIATGLLLTVLFALPTPASSQVLTPGSGGSGSSPAQGSGAGPAAGNSGSSGNNQVLGSDLPFFDAGTETFTWDGRTWNITDQRVFAARFEKYLSAPEAVSEEDQAYRKTLDDILEALSPSHPGGPNLQKAVSLLPLASNYYHDARLCDSIRNSIYGIYLSQNNVAALDRMNKELERQAQDTRRNYKFENEVAGTSRATSRRIGEAEDEQKKEKEKKNEFEGTTDATIAGGYIARITELEAMRLANRTQMATSELMSKVEFQALIVQFFMQRRMEHVVMACRFYRKLFGDGDNQMRFEEDSDVAKAFGQGLGFNPTISTMETIANELIRDVDEGVEAFEFLLAKNQLEGAANRLSEAFMIGEYLPKIRTLKRDDKQKVLQFVRDSNQLISAIEVKDYGLAEELVTRMRAVAVDFDYSKPFAAIETAKRISAMRIRKAKNAAMAGDTETYEENIALATEMWPTNPELKKEFDTIADQADVKNMALVELDRLISSRSYRQIFDDQATYIAASVGDKDRQDQLKEVLTNIQKIDIAITQADKLSELGDKHGAWETVEELFEEFSDDTKLSKVRSDLATEVADFVSSLKKAETLEERKQQGSSLAWYLKARKMYPNSVYAKRGINRLVEEILPDEAVGESSPGEGTF